MTLNDFKAIDGDRQMGVRSLPVQLGADGAALVACALMLLPQVLVVAFLVKWGAGWHPYAVIGLIAAQALLMMRFLPEPVKRATWYSALGVNFYVSGMLISAFAVRGLTVAS
jgi:chlorophyll synthase